MMGPDADALAGALERAPVAKTIVAFEKLMRKWSSQGGADYNQSHRDNETNTGGIPGYDDMSFAQKRAAQMSQNRPSPRRGSS